jgi:hypothetical protein
MLHSSIESGPRLGVPFVGCRNHLLAIDVNDSISANPALTACLESVHKTMVTIKNSIKNTAILRRFTPLRAKIDMPIRWSAKYTMAERFVKLRDELIAVAAHPDSTLEFDTSPAFLKRIKKNTLFLKQVNDVTVAMQSDCIRFCDCNEYLVALQGKIDRNKNRPENISGNQNPWHRCSFNVNKARANYRGALNPDVHFLTGVIKIQHGNWRSLSPNETKACETLLKVNVNHQQGEEQEGGSDHDDQVLGSPLNMSDHIALQRQQKRQREVDGRHGGQQDLGNPYINCDFIFGSTAIVERLWSIGKNILTAQCSSLTPIMFETLLFLRTNKRFWDRKLILAAIQKARATHSEKVKQRMAEDRAEEEAAQGELFMVGDND